MRIFAITVAVIVGLGTGFPVLAKPGNSAPEDEPTVRSPGKPSHPLRVDISTMTSLKTGVVTEGELVVTSAVPVESLEVRFQPEPGLNVLSGGSLERTSGRMHPGEPLVMPLRIEPGSDTARRLVVLVRGVKADGTVISREVKVNIGEPRQKREKNLRRQDKVTAPETDGDAVVRAEQEIVHEN